MSLSRRALLLGALPLPLAAAGDASSLVCPLAAEPAILIPGVSDHFSARLLGSKIYGGLVRFDATGPRPELATGWDISADGLTYAFHLRQGVTWHDSGGFDADDVVFSLGRFHRERQTGLDRVQEVRAVDERTVAVTLRTPFPPFLRSLDALCAPIVPRHVHDRPGSALDPKATTPVGTGPFRVDGWLRLARFAWFAGPRPTLTEIVFPILPQASARTAALGTGPALLAADAVDPGLLAQWRLEAGLVVEGDVPATAAPLAGVRLNPAVEALGDPRVRRALACAIDRAAVLREAWAGFGRIASGPTVSGSQDRDATAALPDFSPREASARLTEAGLRPDDEGIRLRLTHLVPPGRPWEALAGLLRVSLARVGVILTPEPVAAADLAGRVASGHYETVGFLTEQCGDPLLDLAAYAAELPGLAPLLSPERDVAERTAGLAAAQRMLVDAMTRLWLVEPSIPVVRAERLRLPGGLYSDFSAARLG